MSRGLVRSLIAFPVALRPSSSALATFIATSMMSCSISATAQALPEPYVEPPERGSSQARIKEHLGNHSLTALVRVIAETAAAERVVAVAVPSKRAVTEGVACYAIGIAMDIDASHHWRAVDIEARAAAEMVIEQAG